MENASMFSLFFLLWVNITFKKPSVLQFYWVKYLKFRKKGYMVTKYMEYGNRSTFKSCLCHFLPCELKEVN